MKSATNRERRRVVELGRGAHLLDPPALHDGDAVGHGEGFLLVVGHVEDRHVEVLLDVLELELHVGAELLVERAQRLVHQEDARPEDEGPRQRDALLLAAGELARQPLLVAGEPHQLERLADAPPRLGARASCDLERERHVLRHGQMGEHRVALEYHPELAALGRQGGHRPAVHEHLAAGRIREARDHHEGRGLARSARAEQREERAGRDGDGHVAHRDHRPVGLGQLVKADLGAPSYPFCRSHCDHRSLTAGRLSAHHLPFWRNAFCRFSGLDGSRAASSAGMLLNAWRLLGP